MDPNTINKITNLGQGNHESLGWSNVCYNRPLPSGNDVEDKWNVLKEVILKAQKCFVPGANCKAN